jgi:hypothetical protein
MFFPNSLKDAKKLISENSLPSTIALPNTQFVKFTHSFKYLGSTITTELNEDTEIKIRINKAKSTLGLMKHFLNNKDVDIRTKHNIYISFTVNAALWGCESWNLSAKNKKHLESFHHSAIRRILNNRWQQVREDRNRNKQVRFHFYKIPKIESFINKRMATYVGKIARSNDEELTKKLLGAWLNQPRKAGGQQLSCNNNFARAISAVLPLDHCGALFKEWIPIAANEIDWLNYIEAYFETCRTMDEDRDEEDEENDPPESSEQSPPRTYVGPYFSIIVQIMG